MVLGLSPKTFFLLTAVEEHPFPAELARKMHLPPPTVTYMIKQLEERGFLGVRPNQATSESSGSSRPCGEGSAAARQGDTRASSWSSGCGGSIGRMSSPSIGSSNGSPRGTW